MQRLCGHRLQLAAVTMPYFRLLLREWAAGPQAIGQRALVCSLDLLYMQHWRLQEPNM